MGAFTFLLVFLYATLTNSQEVSDGTTTTCYDITLYTQTWSEEITWALGTCGEPDVLTYLDYRSFTSECCLPDGTYTLACMDSYGDGWHGGHIEVDGTEYCQDFTQGFEQTHQICFGDVPCPETADTSTEPNTGTSTDTGAVYIASGPPTHSPSAIEVDLVVVGVTEENKDECCTSVANDLGGTVVDCEILGRRSLQEDATSTLAVVVGDVNAEAAEAQATSDDFIDTLVMPEGVEVEAVEVASDETADTSTEPNTGTSTDTGGVEWVPSGPPTDAAGDSTSEPAGMSCDEIEAAGCVCVTMTTMSWGNEVEWVLSPDVGDACTGGPYENYNSFNEQCCLAEGATGATLECKDSYGDGWHGGFVTILGESYCQDFSYGSSETRFIPFVEGATPEPTTTTTTLNPDTCAETVEEGCFCVTMNSANWGYEVTWNLVPDNGASSDDVCSGGPYPDYASETTMCCPPEGATTLTVVCKDSYGDGWHGGYLSLLGQDFCESFGYGGFETHSVSLVDEPTEESAYALAQEILNTPASSIVYGLAIVGALSTMYHGYTTFLKKKAYEEIAIDFEEN